MENEEASNYELRTQFFKDINTHMRSLCNGVLKEINNPIFNANRVLRRVKLNIKSGLDFELEEKVVRKFNDYLGVRKNIREVFIKDEYGEKIIDAYGFPLTEKKISWTFIGRGLILTSTMEKFISLYSKDTEEDLILFFEEKMSDDDAIEKFVGAIISIARTNIDRTLRTQARNNFAIRTGQFHTYTNPPMGMNEFLRKIVDNDILQIGDNE